MYSSSTVMHQDTTFYVRLLLVAILFLLALGAGLLYIVSLEMAHGYPELAHLQPPIYIASLVGLVPIVMGVKAVFDFLSLVDAGEAFSEETVQLFRRFRVLLVITGGYLLVGLVGVWVALGDMHISILLPWFVGEVVIVFLVTLVTLLEGLFSTAIGLRKDSELTV